MAYSLKKLEEQSSEMQSEMKLFDGGKDNKRFKELEDIRCLLMLKRARFIRERMFVSMEESQRKMDTFKKIIQINIDELNERIYEVQRERIYLYEDGQGEGYHKLSDDIRHVIEDRDDLQKTYDQYCLIGLIDEFYNLVDMLKVDGFNRGKVNSLAGMAHEYEEYAEIHKIALQSMKKPQEQETKLKTPDNILTFRDVQDLREIFGLSCIRLSLGIETMKKIQKFIDEFSYIKEVIYELANNQSKLEELKGIICIQELILSIMLKENPQTLEELEMKGDHVVSQVSDLAKLSFEKEYVDLGVYSTQLSMEDIRSHEMQIKSQLKQPIVGYSVQETPDLSQENMDLS